MIKKTTIELEPGDIELITARLPVNPCDKCGASNDGSCCGCPEYREYKVKIKPIEDAGVFDLASSFNRIIELNYEIEANLANIQLESQKLKEYGINAYEYLVPKSVVSEVNKIKESKTSKTAKALLEG